jgi:hypothetical protein
MKSSQATLFSQGLSGSDDDFIGRHLVGAFFDTTAAQQAFRHGQIGLVIQLNVIFKNMLRQGDLSAGHCRFTTKSGEGGTIGPAGAALDTFFQLILNPFERVVACI